MSTASKLALARKLDAAEGAWVTPGGEPILLTHLHDEGDCAYCGLRVYSFIDVTASHLMLAHPGTCMVWRWFNSEFEPWHIECFDRWLFSWTQNRNGTVHIGGCRHAEPDGDRYQGTRGEARVMLGDRFCRTCAPIEHWIDFAVAA